MAPRLKKQLGLTSCISYITGSIIGVGIFISPTAVLEGVGSSVGLSLLVWTLCGALSYCAAMCYTEYGTRVKKSGGTYTYIREVYGDATGFVFLWSQLVVVRPLSLVVASLASAEYIMRPFFLYCPDMAPRSAKVMLGFVILALVTAANLYSVRLGARLQTLSTLCKLVAITTVIVVGLVHLAKGNSDNFHNPFHTTSFDAGGFALAMYAGFYAFTGWDVVNTAVEEVENPHRTIPLAILGGLAFPTLTYVLANVAYHAVLTNQEILSGVAVAVMFGERTLGYFKWILLPCVAVSAAGIVNTTSFSACRMIYVGGRDNLFPRFLGMVHIHRRTPQPSILVLFAAALVYISIGDLKSSLGAYSFFKVGADSMTILGIFKLRRKFPADENTYQVNVLFPVIYIVFFLALSVTAIVYEPRTFLVPSVITLLGVPVYFLSTSRKHNWAAGLNVFVEKICHQLLLCQYSDPV